MPTPEDLDATIRDLGRVVSPDGAMCTGWVMVAEWVDAKGRWWVTKWADKTLPPWRIEGLLYHAVNNDE